MQYIEIYNHNGMELSNYYVKYVFKTNKKGSVYVLGTYEHSLLCYCPDCRGCWVGLSVILRHSRQYFSRICYNTYSVEAAWSLPEGSFIKVL